MMLTNSKSHNESGFATILMVLLIGLAIAGSAVGTAYYVNSAQKGLVASHALTNAKSGAWTGAETFRRYLDELDEAEIKDLDNTGQNLTLKISDTRELKVSVLSVEETATDSHKYHVTTNIQNISSGSKSSSTLQIVYQVSFAQSPSVNPGSQNTVTFADAMNFYGTLDMHTNSDFTSTRRVVVNVGGDFVSNGVIGINALNVVGNVDIQGSQSGVLESIASNGTQNIANGFSNKFDGTLSTGGVLLADRPIVNALDYEKSANYVFSVVNGNIKVDVRQVSGISDGSYYMGNTTTRWGRLCKEIYSDGGCKTPIVGYVGREGNTRQLVTYTDEVWILDADTNSEGISVAPGVLLFKGSLNVTGGTFANTILSTGDIDYKNATLTAPNRAGASLVCNSVGFAMPTNLCTEGKELRSESIGDIALLAGSCTDTTSIESCSNSYSGGDINFSGQSNVVGNIIAGNRLYSRGGAAIKGQILAAALSGSSTKSKITDIKGNFTIDFGGASNGGITLTRPGGNNSGGGNTITQKAKVKWARYL